ncbi:MAG: hypothetical protein JWO38_1685 [Gemmataceae bacterium]|nr:hypothetical protein [Gemmataceae bacterium]
MPKTVSCPICRGEVKVPRDAEPGDQFTCPGCAEVFTPPHLKKKEHDPDDSEAYAIGEADEDTTERREKKRKAKAIQRAARELGRAEKASAAQPGLGGVDAVLLVFSAAVGAAGLVGYVAARRVPSIGEAALIIIAYGGFLLFLGWRKFMGSGTRD